MSHLLKLRALPASFPAWRTTNGRRIEPDIGCISPHRRHSGAALPFGQLARMPGVCASRPWRISSAAVLRGCCIDTRTKSQTRVSCDRDVRTQSQIGNFTGQLVSVCGFWQWPCFMEKVASSITFWQFHDNLFCRSAPRRRTHRHEREKGSPTSGLPFIPTRRESRLRSVRSG